MNLIKNFTMLIMLFLTSHFPIYCQSPNDDVVTVLDKGYRPCYQDKLLSKVNDHIDDIVSDDLVFVQVDQLWEILSAQRSNPNSDAAVITRGQDPYSKNMSAKAQALYDGRIFSCRAGNVYYPTEDIIDLFTAIFPEFPNALNLGAAQNKFLVFYAFNKGQFPNVNFPKSSGRIFRVKKRASANTFFAYAIGHAPTMLRAMEDRAPKTAPAEVEPAEIGIRIVLPIMRDFMSSDFKEDFDPSNPNSILYRDCGFIQRVINTYTMKDMECFLNTSISPIFGKSVFSCDTLRNQPMILSKLDAQFTGLNDALAMTEEIRGLGIIFYCIRACEIEVSLKGYSGGDVFGFMIGPFSPKALQMQTLSHSQILALVRQGDKVVEHDMVQSLRPIRSFLMNCDPKKGDEVLKAMKGRIWSIVDETRVLCKNVRQKFSQDDMRLLKS
ncbi:MAG: hypothetical protein Q8K36_02690 [Alphaproteobacteria bacterium]|nr:hypothetical protein [Alphaproteobacteria bacterium]